MSVHGIWETALTKTPVVHTHFHSTHTQGDAWWFQDLGGVLWGRENNIWYGIWPCIKYCIISLPGRLYKVRQNWPPSSARRLRTGPSPLYPPACHRYPRRRTPCLLRQPTIHEIKKRRKCSKLGKGVITQSTAFGLPLLLNAMFVQWLVRFNLITSRFSYTCWLNGTKQHRAS